ncbi:hypothetical protein [Streptomyces sp. TR06-5]|uniref:hypothetical protein n=1 Tax=Streptomyces sp. TR06-5 TaxID=3385976 RepID=UPI00399F4D86
MSTRRTRSSRTGAVAVALATGLVLTLSGCSGEDGPSRNGGSSSQAQGSGEGDSAPEGGAEKEVQVEVEGPSGILMRLYAPERDSGGFLTVRGELENTGDEDFYNTQYWAGDEPEVVEHGSSLGGAKLVDTQGKKRYYVLRDTEGRPLCTMLPNGLSAGKTLPIYAQFPAPPKDTKKIDFQLPGWPSATVEIAE